MAISSIKANQANTTPHVQIAQMTSSAEKADKSIQKANADKKKNDIVTFSRDVQKAGVQTAQEVKDAAADRAAVAAQAAAAALSAAATDDTSAAKAQAASLAVAQKQNANAALAIAAAQAANAKHNAANK